MVGVLEESVRGVIGTERRAKRGDSYTGRLALGVDERDNFVRDVGVVLRLHPTAMEWVRAFVGERIALHAVDAENADAPVLDVRAQGANHSLTFLFVLVAHAG